jgi:hypothetical protein
MPERLLIRSWTPRLRGLRCTASYHSVRWLRDGQVRAPSRLHALSERLGDLYWTEPISFGPSGSWPWYGLASRVYLSFGRFGWRFVFLLSVVPIVAVIAGGTFVREPERFDRLQSVKSESTSGDRIGGWSLLEMSAVAR